MRGIFVASILLLASCVTVPQMSTSTPAEVPTSVVSGRPSRLVSGVNQSYWLWADTDGIWHLRTTTAGVRRRFEGRIRPDDGATLSIVTSTAAEWKDGVAVQGKDIVFALETKGHQDGFDFRLTGDGCLELDLRIDGDGNPNRIYLGKDNRMPANAHFMICPAGKANDTSAAPGSSRRRRR